MIEIKDTGKFKLQDPSKYTEWLKKVIKDDGFTVGEICISFLSDEELWQMNKEYLDHDYYTDIITFDYSEGKVLSGEIFISYERVEDNAASFHVEVGEEFRRVIVHGILHLMGHGDHTDEERSQMRLLEEEKMKLFHVEH